MTLTLPTYVSTKYAGTAADFRNAKVDKSGALRVEPFTVTVPAVTVITTVIGLVPFQKGARILLKASNVRVADLDTSTNVTIDIGYTYYDSTLGTSDDNAFATLVTTAQAGGDITFDELGTSTIDFLAAADGWITATIQGGSTTTSGAIAGQIAMFYDL